VGDIDNDGDLDVLVNHLNSNAQLFLNPHASPTRRAIKFRVQGIYPNLDAIGANVNTRFGTSWKYREILAGGNGYQGQNDLLVHVSGGISQMADEVLVRWPGASATRTLSNVPTNGLWTIFPPNHLGDVNRDGLINISDFIMFENFFGMSVVPGCEVIDFNGNWEVDDDDFQAFLADFDGVPEDCNGNGVIDMAEILAQPNLDSNQDGSIDVCDANPADISPPEGDGIVNVDDLLVVINAWGPCSQPRNCIADIAPTDDNDDGVVDVNYLLTVINN
jgi:hypothetical protein